MKFIALFTVYLATLFSVPAMAEVIPVEPIKRGIFGTPQTMTMLYEWKDAELTILVVMGHPGHFGLKVGDPFVKNKTAHLMRGLTYRTKIKANVVILDSPYPLNGISARSSSAHISRIESVIRFYRERLKVPVWLFGHSDGSISVSEYLNQTDAGHNLIAGAILSAGRDETRVVGDWLVPSLVLHHEKDGCHVTTFRGAKKYFLRIKESNSKPTEFATVLGGAESGSPCSGGYHMYEAAYGEALGLIEDFIVRHK